MSKINVFEGVSPSGSIQDAILQAVDNAKAGANPDQKFLWELISIKGVGNADFSGGTEVSVVIHATY